MSKVFAVGIMRHIVDEKNLVKAQRSKLLIVAEDTSVAIYKAKEWLADNVEKGKDYEVLNCAGSSIREVITDERMGIGTLKPYEVSAELIQDGKHKGVKVSIIVMSDKNARASDCAELYLGEKTPVKIISCKESSFEEFLGFDLEEEQE